MQREADADREREADGGADEREARGLPQHQRQHRVARRAERHPHRDFARALCDRERGEPIETERGEQQSDRADSARYSCGDPLWQQADRGGLFERLREHHR